MNTKKEGQQFLATLLENLNLELVSCGRGTVPNDWASRSLVRSFNKFYYYESGEGYIEFEGRHYNPEPRTLLIVPEGVSHTFGTKPQNPYTKNFCHFSARVGSMNLFDLIDCSRSVLLDEHTAKKVKGLLDDLYDVQHSMNITTPLHVKSLLMRLLAIFLEHTSIEGIHSYSTTFERMQEVDSYIREHLKEDMTVEHLSGMYGLHPNYFSLVFKNTFGTPPAKYINQVRMEEARKLLLTTDMLVSEISEKTGFLNVHYFSTAFKKYYDVSPMNYRKGKYYAG